MRLLQAAACSESTHGPGRLQWSQTDRALTDRNGNRLACIPFRFVNPLLPFLRRNKAGVFIG